MNGYNIMKAMNGLDEKYLVEASHPWKRAFPHRWIAGIAAAIAVLILTGIVMVPRFDSHTVDAELDPETIGIDLSAYYDMEHDEALRQMEADGIVFNEERSNPDADHGGLYVISEEIQGLPFDTTLNFARYEADTEELRLAGAIKLVQLPELSADQRDALNRIYKTMIAEYGEPEDIGANGLCIGREAMRYSEIEDENLRQAFRDGTILDEKWNVSQLQLKLRKEDGFISMDFMALFPEYGYEDTEGNYRYQLQIYEASPQTAGYLEQVYFDE